jgi:cysteinyl-tRNA synthetase
MLSGRRIAPRNFQSSSFKLAGAVVYPKIQLLLFEVEKVRVRRRRFHANPTSAGSSDACTSELCLWDSLSETTKKIPLTTQGTEASPPKALAWYTCGPTTYAAMHLGHARTYVWLDMMRRVLEAQAQAKGTLLPLFVMNVTDIDDKILQAAATNHTCALSLSRQAEAAFWKDMDRLNCQRPHIVTRVTEHVESDIVPYIERLVQTGMAYITTDGVYFHVATFEAKGGTYGKLAGNAVKQSSQEQNLATITRTIDHKRDSRDFALWKLQKPGETVAWPSPWGLGRPGWHIECSAMIQAIARQFATTHDFLVHAGGHDLKFPHHTNEIAQAEAYHYQHHDDGNGTDSCPSCTTSSTREWIPHWVHTGHLMVKETKMSKSLGNYLTVQELWFDQKQDENNSTVQGDTASYESTLSSPSDDFRMWCLMGGSYRHKEEYSRSRIRNARQLREKILRFLLDGERWMEQCRAHDHDRPAAESNKRWSQGDHSFFNTLGTCCSHAYQALLDDMNGTRYIANLIQLAEASCAYIRHNPAHGGANVEPIKVALSSCRDLLALVGFTNLTVLAGSSSSMVAAQDNNNEDSSRYVVGGEKALVEELVRFRAAVRMAALEQVKQQTTNPDAANNNCAKSILKVCDELRDKLPVMGIEVMDSKQPDARDWRFCVPRERKS